MKKNLQIIIKQRKNRRKRSRVPLTLFLEKYEDSEKLLDKIYQKISSRGLNQEARKQHIISLVTAFEVYIKETFVRLIDKEKLEHSNLIKKEWKFNFEEVQFIVEKRISPGELIASHYNFQKLENIEEAFSNLLNLKFLSELKKYTFYLDDEKKDFIKLDENYYVKLQKLLDLRHDFTHDINFKDFIRLNDIRDLSSNLLTFVILTALFIEDYLDKKL